MRTPLTFWIFLALAGAANCAEDPAKEFSQTIRPILVRNCSMCHVAANSASPNGPPNFLKASTPKDIEADRGLWRSLAAQLRNRTMPPIENSLTEPERLEVSQWVENQLRATACNAGQYAGAGTIRRLNRREYHNTIRDLLGVDFDSGAIFPADGTGGAGFDTNGETLYVQPMLMERYLQAAQQILDRVIVTPPLNTTFQAIAMQPAVAGTSGPRTLSPNQEIAASVSIYVDGDYDVRVSAGVGSKLTFKVDGADGGALVSGGGGGRGRGGAAGASGGGGRGAAGASGAVGVAGRGGVGGGGGRGGRGGGGVTLAVQVHLERGTHVFTLLAGESPVDVTSLTVSEKPAEISPEKRALHYRLLGSEPGEQPLQPRKAAQQVLATFLPRAFRRPVEPAEVNHFLALYDRAAERGDPYEERVKLALKGVLVSSDFLFRVEARKPTPGIYPLGQYELATRLSYFLWSTMPDEQLVRLADQGRLQDPKVLAAQVDRMLDDPRSHTFITTFIGQWLGTQDVGGRFMPLLTEIGSYYNLAIATDLKAQPVLLFDRIVGENRSILELLTADYTYLTQRLVTFYELQDQIKDVNDNDFHLVKLPDSRRAGVLGLAGVLGMTSHYEQTSPVLRGAWVLETLLGTPVPPPPPGVPPLEAGDKVTTHQTTRERVLEHRANPVCATCHKMMDPIGFGLENFDWMGRWRDKEAEGKLIDATGELPNGEKFNGPVELRLALLKQKDDFVRQVTGKVLGYALGRSLQDGDSCTVQRMVDTVAKDDYRARTLIREVVLSLPFRNIQGGEIKAAPAEGPKVNISSVISKSQDAKAHDNGEGIPAEKLILPAQKP